MSQTQIQKIATEIAKANLTKDEINQLWDLLKDKASALRSQEKLIAKASLAVGNKVITKELSPKALSGLSGQIKTIKKTRADIELDAELPVWSPAAKYVFGKMLRGVPLTCLERV